MNHDWHDLVQRYIAGTLTDDEALALQNALKSDKDLRALYLDYMNLDVALGSHAESRMAVNEILTSPMAGEISRSTRWLSWRPLAAAAAGLVLGMFCTSVVFGYVVPRAVAKEKRLFPLMNGDFEQSGGALPTNPPASFNMWSGDGAEVIAESGEVSPKSGQRMLRFTRAETDPHTPQGFPARCDVYQLIDLREVWGQVAADDEVTLEVRASFLDSDSRPEGSGTFRCRLLVNPGAPDEVLAGWPDSRFEGCAYARTDLRNGPATRGQWRTATAKVILPRNAQVAAVHLGVIRFTDAPQPGAEFGDCYLDDVSLTVTARPLRQKE